MKQALAKLTLLTVLLAPAPVRAQDAKAARADDPGAVVRLFWRAVGDLDGELLARCLDLPSLLVETSDRFTPAAGTVPDAAALRAELERSRGGENAKRRGDFHGTTVSELDVVPLNSTLVYVPHTCLLYGDDGGEENGREGREFAAVALLRKDADTGTWRIMAITVPK